MSLAKFSQVLGVRNVGKTTRMKSQPSELKDLFNSLCSENPREIRRGKISSILFPHIRYFAYYIARGVLARDTGPNPIWGLIPRDLPNLSQLGGGKGCKARRTLKEEGEQDPNGGNSNPYTKSTHNKIHTHPQVVARLIPLLLLLGLGPLLLWLGRGG